LPLIVSGDCISVAGGHSPVRGRYYRNVSLMYMDRDADLNSPATTPSGCIDGMVISHVIGRGAPELVRFCGEPPLVREPDIALFGFERLDQPEEQYLVTSPLRRHPAMEVSTVGALRQRAWRWNACTPREMNLYFISMSTSFRARSFRQLILPAKADSI